MTFLDIKIWWNSSKGTPCASVPKRCLSNICTPPSQVRKEGLQMIIENMDGPDIVTWIQLLFATVNHFVNCVQPAPMPSSFNQVSWAFLKMTQLQLCNVFKTLTALVRFTLVQCTLYNVFKTWSALLPQQCPKNYWLSSGGRNWKNKKHFRASHFPKLSDLPCNV